MKETPLCGRHIALGAKMAEFAGYNMPIEYTGINEEHRAVRESVGVFDVSHMGEIVAKGKHALEFVQAVTSNDASSLRVGDVQYSCYPNEEGGIVDDFLTYRLADSEYLMVVNAANLSKDWAWLRSQAEKLGFDPDELLEDRSASTAQLAVQGPQAMEVVQRLTSDAVLDMKYYTFKMVTLAGKPNVLLSITGYTGAGGCEIYCRNEEVSDIWDALMEAGKPEGIVPAGLGARDTLRLEMGFCLYGHEIGETVSPIEAGLGWITKLVESKQRMVGRSKIEEMKSGGAKRKLVGFVLKDKGIPRQHYPIVNASGEPIGEVTSGTMSPSLKQPVGMGFVQKEYAKVDGEIFIQVRGKSLRAEVVKVPFYKG